MQLRINQEKTLDLIILSIRYLLAFIFLSYGIGKLSGGQFGNLSAKELATPIKDLSLFKTGWYLFDHQPFKYFIAISQITASLLLLYKRTVIIGALMLIPIIVNILIIDLTIMPHSFKIAFTFRLSFYLLFIALLLYYYREDLMPMLKKLMNIHTLKYKHSKLSYLLIPVFMVLLECLNGVFKIIYLIGSNPQRSWEMLKDIF
ncbi:MULTISPECIES: DoxX family protein [unclassified Sphingobacterium]|uniref:DoxX family protein n=1 Tax=unclassified Sphingobacterium TaxID=2609468 RepID=UPI0025FD5DB6|nr:MULTISPECIES: DoxX family protein [unclassified Sphingobacterium]